MVVGVGLGVVDAGYGLLWKMEWNGIDLKMKSNGIEWNWQHTERYGRNSRFNERTNKRTKKVRSFVNQMHLSNGIPAFDPMEESDA